MKEETISLLKKYGQEHILDYCNLLTKEEQQKLEEQILRIDFDLLHQLYEKTKQPPKLEDKIIEYIPYKDKEKLSSQEKDTLNQIGTNIIKKGQYAVITMAGGQGTRLRT